jgi:RNA polymerase sigma-70 factor (ECF subfamily)
MGAPLSRAVYLELLGAARRQARRADEAEDLLHDAIVAALEAGRLTGEARTRAWLGGVVRQQALMQARSAVRRRQRETAWQRTGDASVEPPTPRPPAESLAGLSLPPSLRVVLLLSLTGHSRVEIRHLLRLSDEALRQRIAALRRRLAPAAERADEPALAGALAFGSLRRGLIPAARRFGHFATHDPDGHGLVVNFLPPRAHESRSGGNEGLSDQPETHPCLPTSASGTSATT